MKRKLLIVLAILLILAGAAVACYPMISDAMYRQEQQALTKRYDDLIKEAPAQVDADLQLSRDYNNELLAGKAKLLDPFGSPDDAADPLYEELLDLHGDGSMGYLEIPAINCLLVIYHGADEDVLAKGVGHLKGSSLPVGGKGTHAVLSGHRGVMDRKLFTDLDQLKTGDVFYIHTAGQRLAYQVDQIETVLPEEMSSLPMDPNEDRVTLVTCTPYGVNTNRLLVRGTRIPEETADREIAQQPADTGSTWNNQYLISVGIGAGIAAVVAIPIFIGKLILRKRKAK